MISAPPTGIIADTVKENLIEFIRGGNAHVRFENAVENLPPQLRTVVPPNLPYSIWQLVEHIRITQWDILEFCKHADHKSPQWPEGYWVENLNEVGDETWEQSLQQVRKDREEFIALLHNPNTDIFIPFNYGQGQTFIREAMLIADHTSYHTGEIIVLRRLLGAWES